MPRLFFMSMVGFLYTDFASATFVQHGNLEIRNNGPCYQQRQLIPCEDAAAEARVDDVIPFHLCVDSPR